MTKPVPAKSALLIGLIRPRTLSASVAPVLLALVYSATLVRFRPVEALLCLLVAVGAQMSSNVANDYLDFKSGADRADRKGPLRPISLGLITKRELISVLIFCLLITIVSGLILVLRNEWWLLFVGVAVVAGLFAYSGGPYPLSYHGLGDVAVFLFFGLVPVVFTAYLQHMPINAPLLMFASAMGLANVMILVVNNYRDYQEDELSGKRTTIVRFGLRFGRLLYLSCGIAAILLFFPVYTTWGFPLVVSFLIVLGFNFRSLCSLTGSELNVLLGRTSIMVMLLALIGSALILIHLFSKSL